MNKALASFRADLHTLFYKHPAGQRTLKRLMRYYGVVNAVNFDDARSADVATAKRNVILEIISLASISEEEYMDWIALDQKSETFTFKDLLKFNLTIIKLWSIKLWNKNK